ncbi:NmrA family NAD(P)-binding protein [Poritiphilus flavus]|uniref:NmrA family NAD(P)-binding protein n=1 Tax=Poritiphilus flavus TaxID=2697053 RepID=A0A6L9EDN3_9FLAO|nr:NmrA family NAD(P)-binding protein [Poritiphilus flavus]NAS12884.1 NmrA family NAD(P)-binding protein [Poritiphilus flavus]
MEKIVLFNATGCQGSSIANRLLVNKVQIIAPVRSEKNIQLLKGRNIDAFLTDFSIRSLVPELHKANKVVLQIPAAVKPSLMIEIAENAMDAIVQAGYPKTIVVISSTIPTKLTNKESVNARLRIKEMSLEKLPDSPILSATEYLENFSTAYREPILKQGVIPQTIPSIHAVNYLSWNDLSLYVHAALNTTNLTGKVYPIGGNEGINGKELAERLGKVLKKELIYSAVSHKQLEGILTPIMGSEIAQDYAEFYIWQDTEGAALLNPDTDKIRKLLNIELPSFEAWAAGAFLTN